jgi:hypothetical protein
MEVNNQGINTVEHYVSYKTQGQEPNSPSSSRGHNHNVHNPQQPIPMHFWSQNTDYTHVIYGEAPNIVQ